MAKVKKIAVMLIALFVVVLILGFVIGSVINLIVPPSQAMYGDKVVEDIGGDNMLIATLKGCIKVSEENIPDGNFKTALGKDLSWKNAKNISYVDTSGKHGNMIVWKDSSDNYDFMSNKNGLCYVSDYLAGGNENCFLVHYPEKNEVYGVILYSDEISYTEYQVLYEILDLDKSDFPSTYQTSSSSYGSTSSGSDHYHTVLDDRYTMSRNDPGSYYDHYEYGDNYDIDDYLESEGFD
jgi:hypothetical protein